MKIYSSTYREECEVFGISISAETGGTGAFPDNIILYIKNDEAFGLGIEDLVGVKITDNAIGSDFRMHRYEDSAGIMLLWDHFTDIEHLARLIDLDPDTVAAFEAAYAARPAKR